MGSVTNLKPTEQIEEFCDFLWGVEDGFVYLPSKDPDSGTWFKQFLPWPAGRESVIQTIQTLSQTREVYMAPVLYSKPSTNAVDIRGASVVWAEFDGKLPSLEELNEKGSPLPTLRVRSSKVGNEHWYWKLDKFSTDLKSIQDINRALAYALNADPSGWDIEQVLRPVGSFNHKRGQLPVLLISNTRKHNTFTDFSKVPVVTVSYAESDFDNAAIPHFQDVLLKYSWISTERELLKAMPSVGQRSSMLAKLGYICCEKGLDNSEIYSILDYVDSHWGKFSKRTNKKQCYIRLIDYVRQKHPYKSEGSPVGHVEEKFRYKVRGFMTHFRTTESVEWIIPGLLHNSSSLWFVGKAGSLKTALATDLGINLALNKSILSWQNQADRPLKMQLWSLEMSGPEVKERQETLVKRHTEEELDQLEENFQIYSDPESVRLWIPEEAQLFKEAVLDNKPDGIIIDSAQMSISANMSDEETVKKSIRFLQGLRHQHNFFQITIHHPRKDVAGVKSQRMTLSDLFGSQTMENSATTVIGLAKREKRPDENQRLDLIHLKTRFSELPADFPIELDPTDFTFSRPVISLGGTGELDAMMELAGKMLPKQPVKQEKRRDPGITF